MGSGSSTRGKSLSEGSISRKGPEKYKPSRGIDDSSDSETELPPIQLAAPRRLSTSSGGSAEDYQSNIRPCDGCGETRKTARFGGDSAQWLCAACQLEGANEPADRLTPKQPRRLKEMTGPEQPQPLRKGVTMNDMSRMDSHGGRGRRKASESAGPEEGSARRRKAKKERVANGDRPSIVSVMSNTVPGANDPLMFRRAKTINTISQNAANALIDDRHHPGKHRAELMEHIHEARAASFNSEASFDENPGSLSPKPICGLTRRRRLPGGYTVGDKVTSLVSRLRCGLLVLDLGHEGHIVGARTLGVGEEDLRLLVQFTRGFDWMLPPAQICNPSALGSAKAAGLPGFSWGARVRSLVTYLKPGAAKRELWLGDSGIVVGPGMTPGKIAVRFDDGLGEWNLWPSVLCEADAFATAVQERLAGGFCRGDRVKATASVRGFRSSGAPAGAQPGGAPAISKGPHSVQSGEEGTVVGPGHAAGRLLVHFDSDERVWSLPATQVAAH